MASHHASPHMNSTNATNIIVASTNLDIVSNAENFNVFLAVYHSLLNVTAATIHSQEVLDIIFEANFDLKLFSFQILFIQ